MVDAHGSSHQAWAVRSTRPSDLYGDVLVPDETLGTVVVIGPRGHVHYHGSFPTPDDVSVGSSGLIWVTSLGDGGLWEINAQGDTKRMLTGLAYPSRDHWIAAAIQSSLNRTRVASFGYLTSKSSSLPILNVSESSRTATPGRTRPPEIRVTRLLRWICG